MLLSCVGLDLLIFSYSRTRWLAEEDRRRFILRRLYCSRRRERRPTQLSFPSQSLVSNPSASICMQHACTFRAICPAANSHFSVGTS